MSTPLTSFIAELSGGKLGVLIAFKAKNDDLLEYTRKSGDHTVIVHEFPQSQKSDLTEMQRVLSHVAKVGVHLFNCSSFINPGPLQCSNASLRHTNPTHDRPLDAVERVGLSEVLRKKLQEAGLEGANIIATDGLHLVQSLSSRLGLSELETYPLKRDGFRFMCIVPNGNNFLVANLDSALKITYAHMSTQNCQELLQHIRKNATGSEPKDVDLIIGWYELRGVVNLDELG